MSVPENTVLDSRAQPILKGSIVGAIETTKWDQYQGLVLDPNSKIEDGGFTVAVFFHREVCCSQFNQGSVVRHWDERYEEQLASADYDWIMEEGVWKESPRVIFFRPSDLVVQQDWKPEFYAKRTFPRGYNLLYELADKSTFIPGSHECSIEKCHHPATRVALINAWGNVYPVRTCGGCFGEFHGTCRDELPARKWHPVPGCVQVLAD